MSCIERGMDTIGLLYLPEERWRQGMGEFYRDHPVMSRSIFIPAYMITGFFKTLFFPVIALVGVLALPVIALVKAFQNKPEDVAGCLQAWIFSAVVLGATITFFGLSAYYLPLSASAAIYIAGGVLLVSFQVHRAAQAPALTQA